MLDRLDGIVGLKDFTTLPENILLVIMPKQLNFHLVQQHVTVPEGFILILVLFHKLQSSFSMILFQ